MKSLLNYINESIFSSDVKLTDDIKKALELPENLVKNYSKISKILICSHKDYTDWRDDDDLKQFQVEVKKLGIAKIVKLVNSHDEFERIYDKFNDWNKEKSFIVSKNSPNIIGHITATSHGDDTDRERLDRIFVLK